PPPPRAARTEVWRVLLAGVLVAIALGGVVVAHRYPRERYTHLVNCHQGLCGQRTDRRHPPGADPGAIIVALTTLATAGLIVAWPRLRKDQALRLLALLLAGWALAIATVPALYIELDGYLDGGESPPYRHMRPITLILGPTGSALLVCAAVLA